MKEMEYLVKTIRLKQRMDEIEENDKELTATLNQFADKGYSLDRIVTDERLSPGGDGKKVYLLIFKK
jgi:hypothetical protein